jgi:FkbM family methyltransferase
MIIEKQGLRLSVRDDIASQDESIICDIIDKDTYELLKFSTRINPHVILDIGAHIGTFTLLAKKYWPASRIIAIEPNRSNYASLVRNIELNRLTNVTPMNIALSDSESMVSVVQCAAQSTLSFCVNYENEINSHIVRKSFLDNFGPYYVVHPYKVKCTTLGSVMESLSLKEINLMKLDCEGAEVQILNSMHPKDIAAVHTIFGEYHCAGSQTYFKQILKKFNKTHDIAVNGCEIGWFSMTKKCEK